MNYVKIGMTDARGQSGASKQHDILKDPLISQITV